MDKEDAKAMVRKHVKTRLAPRLRPSPKKRKLHSLMFGNHSGTATGGSRM